jgi:hypothetical protein
MASEIGHWLEDERQRQKLAEAIVLGNLIMEILLRPPPKREHWWQFWRQR